MLQNYIDNYEEFDKNHTYGGNDLGVTADGEISRFKVWAPFCSAVYLNLYNGGSGDNKVETLPMRRIENGVWYVELLHETYDLYYTYTLEYEHSERIETIDIYAKGCGVNGNRGYIPDFKRLNPDGWERSDRIKCESPTDAVIYECNVRDFSISETSGVEYKARGKFAAFSEMGTVFEGIGVCLEHLKELGITHVQLMPVADFATIDEAKPNKKQYNWGYDPKNYMCLEGGYSTDPEDGGARIREFKELVKTLHDEGIGVILDVVLNHTYYTEESAFHKQNPYYFHRLDKNGKFSNGSGCGNETASEHAMMRKYMIDVIRFWATEYKVDGFRFDLMGLHDIETINMIRDELDRIDPSILMYGEGWTGGESPYPADKLCFKWNSRSFGRVGLFNDDIRDGIKGSNFLLHDAGFVSGNAAADNAVKRGLTANSQFKQLCGTADELCWAASPEQSINYCEAHDNHTLWDKLAICSADASESERRSMDKLAAAITILAQGVPFLHMGQDFLRSKPKPSADGRPEDRFDGNSWSSPDETNMIRWEKKLENSDIFGYYKALIKLRKSSGLFRLRTCAQLDEYLSFSGSGDVIALKLENSEECFFLVFNRHKTSRTVSLPEGSFFTALDENGRSSFTPVQGSAEVQPISCKVLKRIRL